MRIKLFVLIYFSFPVPVLMSGLEKKNSGDWFIPFSSFKTVFIIRAGVIELDKGLYDNSVF
jgi:hypothetical protein